MYIIFPITKIKIVELILRANFSLSKYRIKRKPENEKIKSMKFI